MLKFELVQTDKHSIKILLRRKNLRFLRRTNHIQNRCPKLPTKTEKRITMKKVFKIIPLILIVIYAILFQFNNWEKMNEIKIVGFTLATIFPLYLIFMILTEKYIDFKNGFKLKPFPEKNISKTNENIQPNYLSISVYLIGLILLIIYFYNSLILNIQLTYLLYILIGISILSLVLRFTKK